MGANNVLIPSAKSGSYTLAKHIYEHGPVKMPQIREVLPKTRDPSIFALIETWIARGWLYMEADESIIITRRARNFFDGINPNKVVEGEPATGPAFNMMLRPALNRPKRQDQREIPEWSKRPEGFGFVTIGLREVAQ